MLRPAAWAAIFLTSSEEFHPRRNQRIKARQARCGNRARGWPDFRVWKRTFSHPNLSRACHSVRRKVIPDDLAALHDKANALEFADIGDRISGNRDQIGEFPRLDGAHAILPSQHFRGVCANRAKDIEWRDAAVL